VDKESVVVTFLRCMWNNCKNGGWLGLNQSMYDALHLAIKAGFKFEREDFITIQKKFRFGRWCGAGSGQNGYAESFYRSACKPSGHGNEQGNRTAAIAFELWKKRPPFLFKGERLAEGSKLKWWDGVPPELQNTELVEALEPLPVMDLEVSSFAADGSYLNAVWYKEPNWSKREAGKGPDRRFKITRDDLKRVEKAFAPEPFTTERPTESGWCEVVFNPRDKPKKVYLHVAPDGIRWGRSEDLDDSLPLEAHVYEPEKIKFRKIEEEVPSGKR
jgi:hypothetical protein